MKFKALLFFGICLLILSFFLIKKDQILFSFSPQAKVDPENLTDDYEPSANIAVFDNRQLPIPYNLAQIGEPRVLGETNAPKRIEVDLTNQRLYAYEKDKLVYNFLISSGKWGRTPIGRFRIWVKLRYTKMEGGSKALNTYYYLPNVPYTMFFANSEIPKWKGFGIHGTYWHSNFGHPMSHGCINMKTEEVALLYYWSKPDLQGGKSVFVSDDNPGTEVIIYGKTPAV